MTVAAKLPFVSVIVLNYFGEKVIQSCIDSVLKNNYPEDRFEIIVVDNNSKDKSRQLLDELASRHSQIKLIYLKENLGFSKGNNIGIKASSGDYVILLNNDCIVDIDWIRELVMTAIQNPKVFAVNSKVLLYYKYITLDLNIDPKLNHLYSWISDSKLYSHSQEKVFLNAFNNNNHFQAEIPFDPLHDSTIEIMLSFSITKEISNRDLNDLVTSSSNSVQISVVKSLRSEVHYKAKINLQSDFFKNKAKSKLQNAGIIPFHDGYARDIGAIVRDSIQYYEYDDGQYDRLYEVYAACGAALLMNKQVLNKIGLLDETFFMYYEDVEISERARLLGYKNYYSPKAVVRHIHALSSVEGSGFFVFNVEKGRMLHVFYNFPFWVFTIEYLKLAKYIIGATVLLLIRLRHWRAVVSDKQDNPRFSRSLQLVKTLSYFVFNFPYLLLLRYKKQFVRDIGAVNNNYKEILSGRWYFRE